MNPEGRLKERRREGEKGGTKGVCGEGCGSFLHISYSLQLTDDEPLMSGSKVGRRKFLRVVKVMR